VKSVQTFTFVARLAADNCPSRKRLAASPGPNSLFDQLGVFRSDHGNCLLRRQFRYHILLAPLHDVEPRIRRRGRIGWLGRRFLVYQKSEDSKKPGILFSVITIWLAHDQPIKTGSCFSPFKIVLHVD
jgi:hypothetical protein